MKVFIILLILSSLSISASFASKKTWKIKSKKSQLHKIEKSSSLERMYLKKSKNKKYLEKLKVETWKLKRAAVPTLTKVMKSKKFPDNNRWVATYMLGKIMGVKAAPYIQKFTKHPNWMMRLAALKVLLHLKQTRYAGSYARLLEDKSLIVRHQALENIRELKLTKMAPYVWKMLYNKANYIGKEGKRKRSHIIRKAIKTVGDLKFEKAKKPMLSMMQIKRYKDVYPELDYALNKVTKKQSPKGNMSIKKNFWKSVKVNEGGVIL